MQASPFTEMEFGVGGYTLRGRLYKPTKKTKHCHPIIAMHGWLDNCASFSFLAPKLAAADCLVLALDLPGHGRSDHRPGLGAYNLWQDIPEILEVAEQMGWQRFGLLGHSRGAMMATLFAALCPQKINYLALIDGIVPLPLKEGELFDQFRRAIEGATTLKNRPRTYYESFDAAVKAREKGFIALDHEDALVLAERGVAKEGEQFYWANDKKLMIPSEVKLDDRQIREMMNELQVEAHLVMGSWGLATEFGFIVDWLKAFPGVKSHQLEGGHHLHMSQAAQKVADIFIDALPG